jgi:hypothetical protein
MVRPSLVLSGFVMANPLCQRALAVGSGAGVDEVRVEQADDQREGLHVAWPLRAVSGGRGQAQGSVRAAPPMAQGSGAKSSSSPCSATRPGSRCCRGSSSTESSDDDEQTGQDDVRMAGLLVGNDDGDGQSRLALWAMKRTFPVATRGLGPEVGNQGWRLDAVPISASRRPPLRRRRCLADVRVSTASTRRTRRGDRSARGAHAGTVRGDPLVTPPSARSSWQSDGSQTRIGNAWGGVEALTIKPRRACQRRIEIRACTEFRSQ